MRNRNHYVLVHPLFIASILLLLLNDIYLKYTFHNWVTGKLSDFTGLFAFTVFSLAFFPGYKKTVVIFCGFFFIWWKSPFPDSFIHTLNNFSPFQIARVVDYTDLLAITVIPMAYAICKKSYVPTVTYRRVFLNLSCFVSLFAFCNTSMVRQIMYDYPEGYVYFRQEFSTRKNEAEILKILSGTRGKYLEDSIHFYPSKRTDLYYRIQKTSDSLQWEPLTNNNDSALYVRVKEYTPYYIIPEYSIDGDLLKNLEFRFIKKGRKNAVIIQSFQTDSHTPAELYEGKLKRKYMRYFRELFKSSE